MSAFAFMYRNTLTGTIPTQVSADDNPDKKCLHPGANSQLVSIVSDLRFFTWPLPGIGQLTLLILTIRCSVQLGRWTALSGWFAFHSNKVRLWRPRPHPCSPTHTQVRLILTLITLSSSSPNSSQARFRQNLAIWSRWRVSEYNMSADQPLTARRLSATAATLTDPLPHFSFTLDSNSFTSSIPTELGNLVLIER